MPNEKPMTKESAWQLCVTAFNGIDSEIRNKSWIEAVQKRGKPEDQFTADDWKAIGDDVLNMADSPF